MHLASPQVNLTTHVRDLANTILYEDLDDIVLLGFSYGGFVVTGALDHVGDRVRQLVFLDAFVPDDGDTVLALLGGSPSGPMAVGEQWLVPPPARAFDDPEEAAFANPRRTPQPIGCFTEPVRLSRPLEAWELGRTYIKATVDEPGAPAAQAFWAAADRARASPRWSYRELATTHMVPNNRPLELAELLLELG